jgi:AraC-like DNA-binding protein
MTGSTTPHRVLPDGCIDILVVPGRGATVVGTMRHAFVAPPMKDAVLGIRFRPGEAARLLREAPRELTDDEAPLETLWGDDGRALEGALLGLLERATHDELSAEQVLERAHVTVETSLRRRLAAHGEAVDVRVRAAAELLASGRSVGDVAARVELSERQLTRRFTERIGIAPKLFARVMRLQRATALLHAGVGPSEAASRAGYADQAHFTRDAADLGGITPAAMAREVSDSFNTGAALAG